MYPFRRIVVTTYRNETISGRFRNSSSARILRSALMFNALSNLAQTGFLFGKSFEALILNFLVWQIALFRTSKDTLLIDTLFDIMLIFAFAWSHNCRMKPLIYGLVVHRRLIVLNWRYRIFISANHIKTQLFLWLDIQQIHV